jgi:hypothetical protein
MTVLVVPTGTIHYLRSGRRAKLEVEIDQALELGLTDLTLQQRRLFNALHMGLTQTEHGWMSEHALLRIAWGHQSGSVSRTLIYVSIGKLKKALCGTDWLIESAKGGMNRLRRRE